MTGYEADPEIRLLNKVLKSFDYITVRLSVVVVLTLFGIGLTLVMFGISLLIESWELFLGNLGFSSKFFPLVVEGDLLTVIIGAIGATAIGYAVLDLARSILREEIEEERIIEVQQRARDFITRILSVVVIALAVGTFVNEAKYSATNPGFLWQVSTIGVAIAAILVGWGTYLKFSKKQK
ncbi:MAG: hypothetical protein ABH834_06275 [Candidatus Altiarchaeota archaeon]